MTDTTKLPPLPEPLHRVNAMAACHIINAVFVALRPYLQGDIEKMSAEAYAAVEATVAMLGPDEDEDLRSQLEKAHEVRRAAQAECERLKEERARIGIEHRRLIAEAEAKEREAWREVGCLGRQMANIAFNWSQQENETGSRLMDDERALLKDMQRQWDAAIRARAKQEGGHG